ncbi:DUF2252 domain-containing protein [Occultella aeris]|uniref:DUF2252 domain-containing protein n=1 Tax=Occultella aeris TaxID=2761496 RepID=A0A7M4DND6_9MICO|nr:hypothetical protein HALOF300_03666 [Occultella aeris]
MTVTGHNRIERYPTRRAAHAAGRQTRKVAPRRTLGTLATSDRDPVAHLREQNADRLPELVPLRMARMLQDPFAFYRGTAGLMALDLADSPSSGLPVIACGDAHLSNFGIYATPERRLTFDLNDFDEAAAAPWEWDLKRLVTSAVIGGRHAGYAAAETERAAREAVAVYAAGLKELAALSPAARYFMHTGKAKARGWLDKTSRTAMKGAVESARKRTAERAVRRTTERGPDGRLRFVETPPTMTHPSGAVVEAMTDIVERVLSSMSVDIAVVLRQYEPLDLVRRVVGVGSVGTRCYLHLMGGADDDVMLLQVKEAGESVLVRYGRVEQPPDIARGIAAAGNGLRVVALQRVLQGVSDPYLGHVQVAGRDYYLRQFHDMKGSIDLDSLDAAAFRQYVAACASILARAHSQSPTASKIVGYIGNGAALTDAITEWAYAYADQSRQDFDALRAAADDGRVPRADQP